MARKMPLITEEHYHIFNRGVDKRNIFIDQNDYARFLLSMELFNTLEPIGSIYEHSFQKNRLGNGVSKSVKKPLLKFTCYCLNPNHYHFVVRQLEEEGIAKFMHRLSLGYTKYFNEKYDRSGSLFQGPFKAVYIESNKQLLYVGVYVNLNDQVHRLGNGVSKSSWEEYTGGKKRLCDPDIILSQFKNPEDYQKFAEESLTSIQERRDLENLLLE